MRSNSPLIADIIIDTTSSACQNKVPIYVRIHASRFGSWSSPAITCVRGSFEGNFWEWASEVFFFSKIEFETTGRTILVQVQTDA